MAAGALGLAWIAAGCGGQDRPTTTYGEPESWDDDAPGEAERPAIASAYRDEIAELASPLVDEDWVVGLTIGWVAGGEREVLGLGETARGAEPPRGDTIYEIGSITKAFVGVALAASAESGEVDYDTPVGELLDGLEMPSHPEGAVTLEHLATHTSGLPQIPDNLAPEDPDDPYADYGDADIAEFLAEFEAPAAPGEHYRYSNLGAGLLGRALSAAAGASFADFLADRVLSPLGMEDTRIRLRSDQLERLAQGHAAGEVVPPWTFDTLAGAGALRSTADDLLTFVEAHLGDAPDDLADPLAAAVEPRDRLPDGDWVGLGWHIGLEARGGPPGVVWHNGGTGGFHSFVALDPDREVGVVVLANSMQPAVESLGVGLMELLRGGDTDFEVPRRVDLDREILERYEGVYELAPGVEIAIGREGDHLIASVSGQPRYPIYPASETEFFYRIVDARISFDVAEGGEVEGLTLYQAGVAQSAPKVRESEPRALPDVVEVELDGAILDRKVGVYEVAENLYLEVERDGRALTARLGDQGPVGLLPLSETEFTVPQIGVELDFVVGDDGAVEAAIIRDAGREREAPKID